ncbi:MAG: hypothetical protein GWP61_00890 [Chloroflexi bacterium]|jgi:hypothetical protein|nr:hypothetical protein [Chloroflexota bacterium]
MIQIKVQERLDGSWSDWFEGMTISFDQEGSTLTGMIVDQVALRAVLSKLWDLNLTLLSVNRIETISAKR